ncbi:SixA phosphatase family protein [Algoriphagus namhaensis]|uniref:SixA phosphatase family protein n=1 Tax=Algoriphagus namhaensis TaxID=915353 RepID=A0ABV8ARE9_9BACT
MKNLLLILLGGLILVSCGSSPEPKTIYIVRHAEKMLVENPDPELAQVGIVRSKKLAQILADKEIKHIFSTDYKRTRMTAQPTADQLGIQIETYDPRDQEAFAEKLKGLEGNILVVGHSNTAPRLANILIGSGSPYPDLTDVEYDNIYILEYKENGFSANVKKYGDF